MLNFKKFGEVESQPLGSNVFGDLTVVPELKIQNQNSENKEEINIVSKLLSMTADKISLDRKQKELDSAKHQ